MISPSMVLFSFLIFPLIFLKFLSLIVILNKRFLEIGINSKNPIKSVRKPGIIKSKAANAIEAPEISS